MSKTIAKTATKEKSALDARVAPALFALLFGAFLVLGTGFAQSTTVHNAAHDARHAFAFPCH